MSNLVYVKAKNIRQLNGSDGKSYVFNNGVALIPREEADKLPQAVYTILSEEPAVDALEIKKIATIKKAKVKEDKRKHSEQDKEEKLKETKTAPKTEEIKQKKGVRKK